MEKAKAYFTRLVSALALCSGMLPVFGVLGVLSAQEGCLLALCMCGLCQCFGVFMPLIRGKGRTFYLVISLVLYGAVLSYIIKKQDLPWPAVLWIVPGVCTLLLMPRLANRPPREEWGDGLWFGGIAAGLLCQLILFSVSLEEVQGGTQIREILQWDFVLYMFLWLLNKNGNAVRGSAHVQKEGGVEASPQMLRRNRLVCILLFLLSGAIAFRRQIGDFFVMIWENFKRLIGFLVSLLPFHSETELAGEQSYEGGADGFIGAEEAVPSPFWAFLEKVIKVIAIAAIAALALYVLYALGKRLVRAVRRMLDRMKAYSRQVGEDYVDETQNIFRADEMMQRLTGSLKNAFGPGKRKIRKDWKQMTEQERVRSLYAKRYAKKESPPSSTARAVIQSDGALSKDVENGFVSLYETARYSSRPLQDGAAEQLKNELSTQGRR